MDKTEYQTIDASLRSIFDRYAAQLSNEGRENIQHFIDATEIEMACESFILSVLKEHVQLSDDVRNELRKLALALHLDKESVFRADFWVMAGPLLSGEK